MAYRKKSFGARRSSGSRGMRRTAGRRSAGGGRSAGRTGGQHTLRIVLEHPASNPMMTAPVGMKVDTAAPARAKF